MRFSVVALVVLFILATVTASAQTISFGFDYGRQSLKPNFDDPLKDVDSIRVNGSIRVAGSKNGNGLKFKLGGEYQKTYDKVAFYNYLETGMNIYRDPNSAFGFGELEYRAGAFGVGARAYLGAEKLHEDLEWALARKYQFRGTIYAGKHFGITPLFIEFKKEAQGFDQGFGAGVTVSY